jgi:hypothetical protein
MSFMDLVIEFEHGHRLSKIRLWRTAYCLLNHEWSHVETSGQRARVAMTA